MPAPDARDIFGQAGFDCRMEWGMQGLLEAADRGDVIVVVDVLSFSSTTVAGVECGARIYPYPMQGGAEAYAARVGAELRLGDAVPKGRRALSPLQFGPGDAGARYVLCSPNGAACAHASLAAPALFAGCLRNAGAVARAAGAACMDSGAGVTVIACGEGWNAVREGASRLRPCVEDYLGAGAVLAAVPGRRSPEAEVCAMAFAAASATLDSVIWDCASGRELRARGYADDVRYCARLDASRTVPRLVGDHFADAAP